MRKSMRFTAIATIAALTLATGCSKDEGNKNTGSPDMLEPDTDPVDMKKPPKTDAGPVETPPDSDPVPTANVAGIFHKVTTVDLSGKGVLPGVAGDVISALSLIDTAPGTAIYELVANAGIPDVSDALKNLDPTLQIGIKVLLDNLLVKLVYDKVPEVKQVVDVLAGISEVFQKIEFHSQVALRNYDPATGSAEAQEQFYGVAFDYKGNKQLFKFPVSVLPDAKISGGKKLTNIVPVNAPEANYKDALLDGGNLKTFPIGDIFVEAIEKMVVLPLSGQPSFAALLNSVIPCGDISTDPTLQTICSSVISALTETALSPIKNFKFENVTIDRAKVLGFEVSTAQPTVDNLTSRMTGTQPITFQQVFSSDVKIKIEAPFEALRMDAPELPVAW